jgi:hypothetical protein
MLGMKLNDAKSFFSPPNLMNSVDKAEFKMLGHFGGEVRKIARRSIRRRKRTARPGQAPSNRTGLLRDNIFYVVEFDRGVVTIGPVQLNGTGSSGSIPIPQLLEEGGQVRRTRLSTDRNGKVSYQNETLEYAPHPYMGPAFEKAKAFLPGLLKGSVK